MRASVALAAAALGLFLVALVLALASGRRARDVPAVRPVETATAPAEVPRDHAGFISGRVVTLEGGRYEGRLRWGGDEEAFWGDYFNGTRAENPWAAHAGLAGRRHGVEVFGIEIFTREPDLVRPFMARFGDISRIEAHGAEVWVTLKSGSVVELDRLSASDFDDGVRVWDVRRGVVDVESRWIRTVDLLPTVGEVVGPSRLQGTVRTSQGEFTGFVQWNREDCVGTDELVGQTADGEIGLRYDGIRSIERVPPDSALVTMLDGGQVVLSGPGGVGGEHRGIYVDDRRYGRVLVSWSAFERLDFGRGGGSPAYDDFPRGRPITGRVTARDGRRLAGRLVYDLDESETTETLDAPFAGIDYTIPFGLIDSITPGGRDRRGGEFATVGLHGGEVLRLELAGDLGEGNGGMLVFVDGRESPEYLPWVDVERVDLDRPPQMYPPIGGS